MLASFLCLDVTAAKIHRSGVASIIGAISTDKPRPMPGFTVTRSIPELGCPNAN